MKRIAALLLLLGASAFAQSPTYTPDVATLGVTLGSLNAAATIRLEGRAGAAVLITTANLDATVVPEVSVNCSTWSTARFLSPAGVSASSIVFSGGSATEAWTIIAEGGMCGARARVSVYASGTSAATIRATYVSGAHFATQPISGTVTVTDGAGALNVIVDSATLGTVTVSDGAGALNTIVDSGTLTAVTSITNTVTVSDGAGAMNVIVDSGAITASATDLDIRNLTATDVVTVTDGAGSLNVIVDSATLGTVTVSDGAGAMNVIVDSSATIAVDTTSADQVTPVGVAADGAAVTGNPILVAGQDGTNAQSIKTDTTGSIQVDVESMPSTTVTATDLDIRNLNATDDLVQPRGAAADGAAVTGNPILIAGQDGTNAQSIKTDTTGSVQVDIESSATIAVDTTSADQITPLGTAADGGAVSGNPLRIGGKDGSGNTQDIITDTSGELQVDVLTLPSVTIGTFPDNEPFNQAQRGAVAVVAGACERETLLYIAINQATGTQLITGTASERIYICSIQLVVSVAQNVALMSGTGTVCATSPGPMLGGTTAATGWNLAANGGIVLPATRDSWTKTDTDADNVCLLQSGTAQISGSLSYISIPNI